MHASKADWAGLCTRGTQAVHVEQTCSVAAFEVKVGSLRIPIEQSAPSQPRTEAFVELVMVDACHTDGRMAELSLAAKTEIC